MQLQEPPQQLSTMMQGISIGLEPASLVEELFLLEPKDKCSITMPALGLLLETGSTPQYYTIFQGGDQSADQTYTLPTAYPGANDYVLTSQTDGTLSWQSVSGVGSLTGSGTNGQVAYWTGTSSLGGEDQLATSRGGTGLDTSSSTGVLSISSGTWSVSAQLATALGGTGDDTSSTTGVPYIDTGNWQYEAQLAAARGGTGLDTSSSTGVATVSSGTWSVDSSLGVTLGGTGTTTQFTEGSIVFAGASGVYTQDNANFFWDDSNDYLGLGTATPSAMLDIYGTGNELRLSYDGSNYVGLSSSSSGELLISSSSSTESAIVIGDGSAEDTLIQYDGSAQDYYIGLDDTDDALKIGLGAAVGTTPYMTFLSTGYVGVGIDNPLSLMHIGSAGTPGDIDGTDDLYVYDDLEVDGTIYGNLSGTINPGFTQGSVVFQGASGLDEDNANFFWDDTGDYLGIGTATPDYPLELATASGGVAMEFSSGSVDNWMIGIESAGFVFYNNADTEYRMILDDVDGYVGIGSDPSSQLDVQQAGTAKANTNMLELTNSGNAADMDGTLTSILFNQFYYDATTPAVADSGLITIGTETDWTSTAGTQDSYMALSTALDGTLTEWMRVTSAGNVGIGQTSPSYVLDIDGGTGVTDLFRISADGTDVITVTDAQSTFYNPVSFESVGDVSIANDLIMTNATAGYINFDGPGYIRTDHPSSNLNLTLSAANDGFVVVDDTLRLNLDSTSTTGATEYGLYQTVADTGVVTTGTDLTYGQYLDLDRTGATGGTINTYGQYTSVTGDTGGTSTAIGGYFSATGADTNYGLLVENGDTGFGITTPLSLVHVGSAGTPGDIDGTDDLYVYDDLEVDGTIYGDISGTINPGFTEGSVVFMGASGLEEDNANFFWDDTSDYLGLGTATPSYVLDIDAASGSTDVFRLAYDSTDILTVTDAQSTFYNPVNFASAGDVSIAYDLIMANTTAGYINFEGPGYIRTDSGFLNLDLTLSAANDGFVVVDDTLRLNLDSTATTAGTEYGIYQTVDDTGVVTTGTDTTYGDYLALNRTGATGGTITSYGTYVDVTGDTGGTSTAIGGYFSASGADTNYGLIVEDGNVGIGTTTPSEMLHVADNIYTEDDLYVGSTTETLDNSGFSLDGDDAFIADSLGVEGYIYSDLGLIVGSTTTYADGSITFTSGNAFNLTDGATNFVNIDTSGAITMTPTSGQDFAVALGTTGDFIVNTDDLFVDTSSAYVGIGTATPSYVLDVNAASGSTDVFRLAYDSTDILTVTDAQSTFYNPVSFESVGDVSIANDLIMTNATAGYITYEGPGYIRTDSAFANLNLTLSAANDGLVIVDDDLYVTGDTGLGTSNPQNKLHVEGTDTGSAGIYLNDATPGTTTATLYNDAGDLYWAGTSLTGGGALPSGTEGQMLYNNAGTWTAFGDMTWDDTSSYLGIGTATPATLVELQEAGTVQTNTNIFSLTNSGNAADMDGTLTSILFNQYYYDASTPAVADSGLITIGTETDWTSTAATQDSFMALSTAVDGTLTERMRIDSAGNVGIGQTSPSYVLDIDGGTGVTDLFRVSADGTDVITVTDAQTTFFNPVNFASAGDLSVAYDIIMTNETAANLQFNGPGYVKTDSAWANLDLTLSAANDGYVVVDDTLQLDLASTSTTAATEYGLYQTVADTGIVTTGTDLTYGQYLDMDRTGATGGTITSYGTYVDVTGDTGGTSTAVGGYFSASGADDNTALIAHGDSASEETELRIINEATDGSSQIVFQEDTEDVFIIRNSGSQNQLEIDTYEQDDAYVFDRTGGKMTLESNGSEDAYIRLYDGTNYWTMGRDDDDSDTFKISRNATPGTNDYFNILATGEVGIGTTTPSNLLDLEQAGTAKANTNMFELTNSGNAADMDGTLTSILFNQYYYDAATPAVADSGLVTIGTETDWTSTAATQDSFMALSIALDGTLTERMRIDSAGNVGIGQTSPSYVLDIDGGTGVTDLFRISADGTDVVTVTDAQTTIYNPVNFASAGDVSMAYDLIMSNATAAYMKFNGAGYIQTDSAWANLNLTLSAATPVSLNITPVLPPSIICEALPPE